MREVIMRVQGAIFASTVIVCLKTFDFPLRSED